MVNNSRLFQLSLLEKSLSRNEIKNYFLNPNKDDLEYYAYNFRSIPNGISTMEYEWYKGKKKGSY